MKSHHTWQPATLPPPYTRVLPAPPPSVPLTPAIAPVSAPPTPGSAVMEYDLFDNPRPAARFRNLYCSNLPADADEAALLELFAGLGATSARVSTMAGAPASTSGGKRFGFVFFDSEASGKRAHTVIVARRAAGTLPLPIDVFPSRHTTKFLRRRFQLPCDGSQNGVPTTVPSHVASEAEDNASSLSSAVGSSTRGQYDGASAAAADAGGGTLPVPVSGLSLPHGADTRSNTSNASGGGGGSVEGFQPHQRRRRHHSSAMYQLQLHPLLHFQAQPHTGICAGDASRHAATQQHRAGLHHLASRSLDDVNSDCDACLDPGPPRRIICRTRGGDQQHRVFAGFPPETVGARRSRVLRTLKQGGGGHPAAVRTPLMAGTHDPGVAASTDSIGIAPPTPTAGWQRGLAQEHGMEESESGGQSYRRRQSNPYSASGVEYIYS